MRSSKYHDFSVLKIALFIILVILGLIMYNQFLVPSLGHEPGAVVYENIVPSTCIEQGSREAVVYCSKCNIELSRVKEALELVSHTPGRFENEVVKEATCTEEGSHNYIGFCSVCDEEISKTPVKDPALGHKPEAEWVLDPSKSYDSTHVNEGENHFVKYCKTCGEESGETKKVSIPAKGHFPVWELKYDSKTGDFTMVGTCDCGETGNVITATKKNGLKVELDTTVPSCCRKIMIGTYKYNGVNYTATIELEPDSHAFCDLGIDLDGEEVLVYFPVSDYAKWDDEYGVYYEHDGERFIFLNREGNKWDENGFAIGAYQCERCKNASCTECGGSVWYIVRIYNPEYDTRITK